MALCSNHNWDVKCPAKDWVLMDFIGHSSQDSSLLCLQHYTRYSQMTYDTTTKHKLSNPDSKNESLKE